MLDLYILYAASLFTFSLFGLDKHYAIYQKKRVPEIVLLFFSLFAGAFGALCAMILFRHKTLHRKFTILIPAFLVLQLTIDIIYRVF